MLSVCLCNVSLGLVADSVVGADNSRVPSMLAKEIVSLVAGYIVAQFAVELGSKSYTVEAATLFVLSAEMLLTAEQVAVLLSVVAEYCIWKVCIVDNLVE